MFIATEFIYDGIYSGTFGLKIADFDNSALNETTYVVPNIETAKSVKSNKFYYQDIKYDAPPTHEFSVVSETAILESTLRDILNWINARKGFKELVVLQQGLNEIRYNCIFTVSSLIYHRGDCIGLNLIATFDSPYHYGTPIEKNIFGNGSPEIIEIFNSSDNIDEYTYPTVEFDSSDGSITIVNLTDDATREFRFTDVVANSLYRIDNQLKIITGEGNNLLSKFSKKWLRLRRGTNRISVTVNGAATIICPQLVKITF